MLVLWDHLRHHARGGSRVQVGLDIEVVELRAVPDCLHGWQCEPALGSRAKMESFPHVFGDMMQRRYGVWCEQ